MFECCLIVAMLLLIENNFFMHQIKCSRCQGKSERQERMMDLTVEIEGDIATLEEALRRFTGTEVLDGENKYQCSRLAMFLNAFENTYFLYAMQFLSKKKEKRRQ